MLTLILTLGGSTTALTSCLDDENILQEKPAAPDTPEEALRKQLIRSENIDISDIISEAEPGEYDNDDDEIDLTNKSIGLWDLREDGTFTYYIISGLAEDGANDDSKLDSLKGTWKAFANQDNPWEEGGEKLEGF